MSNKMHVLNLYIYLSIILCNNLLFSYDHSKYKVWIFNGCIYVQSIFILIDLNISFDNDIAAHRAAIGLFYCKINGISHKKCVFVTFCFRDAFCDMANLFRNMFKNVHAISLINHDVNVITLLVIHLLLLAGDI